MEVLALHGGSPAVPTELRSFPHPLALRGFPFESLRDIAVLDYNGGGLIDDLERRWAKLAGCQHGLATNSGTSALMSMFYGVGLRAGDEVIVPAYTFFATATPLHLLGCVPVPVDCLPDGNIDPAAVEREITTRTTAVVVTHMWGNPCAIDELLDICKRHGLQFLEDASHSHGASFRGGMVGSFGQAAAWSFGARKLVTGGQGGLMVTSDRRVYERGILLGHYNRRGQRDISLPELVPYATTGTGANLRMHPYSAALIHRQLDRFEEMMGERRETAQYLTERLSDVPWLRLPEERAGVRHAWYAYPIVFDERTAGVSREKFLAAVSAEGATEVDSPGSTRPLLDFRLFSESLSGRRMPSIERAATYYKSLIKLPTWYGPERARFAAAYADGIEKVVRAVQRSELV